MLAFLHGSRTSSLAFQKVCGDSCWLVQLCFQSESCTAFIFGFVKRNVMKIEFTRAEIEQIILDHANRFYANPLVNAKQFNTVTGGSYRDLPSSVFVESKEVQHDGE
jgi:hypothetical protein